MASIKGVFCLDSGAWFHFTAMSGYDAMTKMLYFLNLSKKDINAKIEKLAHCWTMDHCGKTYSAII